MIKEERREELFTELVENQLKGIPNDMRLNYKELKRISQNINHSLFREECTNWYGSRWGLKGPVMYMKGGKYALNRVKLKPEEIVKKTCKSKNCCNFYSQMCCYQKLKKLKVGNAAFIPTKIEKNVVLNF